MPTGKGIYKLKMCGIACSLNQDDLTLKVLLQLQIQNKSSVGEVNTPGIAYVVTV